MSKIPQRVKEPSSYARIFAKHKANQPKKSETNETYESDGSYGEPTGTSVNIAGSNGTVSCDTSVPRVSGYGGTSYKGMTTA